MATSVDDPNQIDYLSNLPDDLLITILSLLPTPIAARTSVLSRHFRHLWEASPSLYFTMGDIPEPKSDNFIAMADRALLRRNPSYPLHSFHLDLCICGSFIPSKHASFISSLFAKASCLRVRHLTVRGCLFLNSHIIPIIFSTDSLRSLSIDYFYYPNALHFRGSDVPLESDVPFENTFNCLKFLCLGLCYVNPVKFEQFISELSSLEELHLEVYSMCRLSILSKTIRKLKLTLGNTRGHDNVTLSLPSLDSLELVHCDNYGPFREHLPHFHGKIPLLRKAVIFLFGLHVEDVSAITGLLNCMSHVEELSLHMKEGKDGMYPFPILLEPGKSTPNFLNLKHFDVIVCFHRYNFEDVVSILHHAPALESLKLVHEVTWEGIGRKSKDWGSNLPHNDDGDNRYAYFRNLHLGGNRDGLMKLITKKRTSKHMTSLDLPSLTCID